MAVGLSTLGQTAEKMEAAEQATISQEQPTETSATQVTESGSLEQAATPETTTEVAQPTEQAVEENVSTFDLGQPETPAETPQETAATQPAFNWKDEIKKLDVKEVAKELGLSDFALEMNEYLAKGGNAADYINAKGYDWNKVSDEELVKAELKNQFPDASDLQIQRVYNKKYTQREEDLDEDKEDGLLIMKADARKLREEKIQRQNSFKIPEAIIPQVKDEAYEQWKQGQQSQAALMEQLDGYYKNHEATKTLNESKRVAVSLGEGAQFNFSVSNPEVLTRVYTDGGETWQKITSTQSGEPDVRKQQLIALFAHNPEKYSQDLFNYGVQMGKKKLVEEGQNAQRPQQIVRPNELNSQASYSTGRFADKSRN